MAATIRAQFGPIPYVNASEVAFAGQQDHVWGQKLFVGRLNQWLAPPVSEETYDRGHSFQSTFHLPDFLQDDNFTGDAYFPQDECYYSSPRLSPQAEKYIDEWRRLTREPETRVYYAAMPATSFKDGEYHTSAPHSRATPSPTPAQAPTLSTRPPVFHIPTADEIARHLETMEELRRLRTLEGELDVEQRIRDAADGRRALPLSPQPRVLVLPSSSESDSDPSTSASTSASSSAPSLSRSASASSSPPPTRNVRSPTPVRYIPSLSHRFPQLFSPDAAYEHAEEDAEQCYFADQEDSDVEDHSLDECDPEALRSFHEVRYDDDDEEPLPQSEHGSPPASEGASEAEGQEYDADADDSEAADDVEDGEIEDEEGEEVFYDAPQM